MKLKAAFRYQAVELVQSAAVFCLIIGAIIAVLFVSALANGMSMMLPSMGALPYVLMVLLALSTFPGDVRFLMQMGLTRLQMIASSAASLGAACLFFAVVEAACSVVFPFWPSGQSLFLMTYGAGNGPVLDFLFMLLGCAAASAAGLAFAALQMRFGTRRVVLCLVAIVLAMIAMLPLVLPPSAFPPAVLISLVQMSFGFTADGLQVANPFILFIAATALGVLVAWAAVRRIEVS